MNSICRDIDPEQVERLNSYKKEKARKNMIRKFLISSYFSDFKYIENPKEFYLIKNTYNFCKIAASISMISSLCIYKILFSGIYEYRKFHFNTNSIPFGIRLLISGICGYFVFDQMWMDYCYNPQVYEIAVSQYK